MPDYVFLKACCSLSWTKDFVSMQVQEDGMIKACLQALCFNGLLA